MCFAIDIPCKSDFEAWFDQAVEDVGEWFEQAVEDTGDWFEQAVEDTVEFFDPIFDDAGEWIEDAWEDAGDWWEDIWEEPPTEQRMKMINSQKQIFEITVSSCDLNIRDFLSLLTGNGKICCC